MQKPYDSELSIFMRSPMTPQKQALLDKVGRQAFEEQDKLSHKYDKIISAQEKKVHISPDFMGDNPDNNRVGTCYYVCAKCDAPLSDKSESIYCEKCENDASNQNK